MKRIIASIAVLALGALLITGFRSTISARSQNETETEKTPSASLPWIEIVAAGATEIDPATGSSTKKLETGDQLAPGSIVETDDTGFANIYFPDGSVSRLDKKSRVTITEASFDEKSGSVIVRLSLGAGRIWSKVVSLITPESAWEVDTANTVVTVRGTAFGVEFNPGGKSTVIGSEGRVAARRKNPDPKLDSAATSSEPGKTTIPEEEVVITADTFVDIENAPELTKKDTTPLPRLIAHRLPEEIARQDWIEGNKQEDQVIREIIETIQEEKKDEREAIREFRQEIREHFIEKIEERKGQPSQPESERGAGNQPQEQPGNLRERFEKKIEQIRTQKDQEGRAPLEKPEAANSRTGTEKPAPNQPIPDTAQKRVEPILEKRPPAPILEKPIPADGLKPPIEQKPVSLQIRKVRAPERIVEGDTIEMRAVVITSDGKERDVTNEAEWKVVGPIGMFTAPGIFTPKLDASISETGSGQGVIAAVWKNPATGEQLFNKSPIITVNLRIEETGNEIAP